MYNVEKYIGKCLDSCVNQDLPLYDYEIIVINDGSQDNSLMIAQKALEGFNNATIYSQKNMGLSHARNKGLSLAKGEYVWFIDSDDWIKNNCLNDIYNQCKGKDVLLLGYIRVNETNSEYSDCVKEKEGVHNGVVFLNENKYVCPAQMYVIRRSFLITNNLHFVEGIYHEDMEFTPRMLLKAEKMCALNYPVYYFLKRANSITTSFNPQKAYDLLYVASSLSKICTSLSQIETRKTINNIISTAINNALNIAMSFPAEQKKNFLNDMKQRNIIQHLLHSSIMRNRVEGILFSAFPNKSLFLYRIFKRTKK
jgi:glycosyltransferase involved in cell wall biosynthesis